MAASFEGFKVPGWLAATIVATAVSLGGGAITTAVKAGAILDRVDRIAIDINETRERVAAAERAAASHETRITVLEDRRGFTQPTSGASRRSAAPTPGVGGP